MSTDSQQAALWYWQAFALEVEVFDSEAEAAEFAVHMFNQGDAAIVGVQLADGTLHDRDHWPAFAREYERITAEDAALAAEARKNPPPTRTVRSPFDTTKSVVVLADTPTWVGAQPAPSGGST